MNKNKQKRFHVLHSGIEITGARNAAAPSKKKKQNKNKEKKKKKVFHYHRLAIEKKFLTLV